MGKEEELFEIKENRGEKQSKCGDGSGKIDIEKERQRNKESGSPDSRAERGRVTAYDIFARVRILPGRLFCYIG